MSIELPAFTYAHNLSKKYAIVLVGIKVLKTQAIFQRGGVSMSKGGIQRYISPVIYVKHLNHHQKPQHKRPEKKRSRDSPVLREE